MKQKVLKILSPVIAFSSLLLLEIQNVRADADPGTGTGGTGSSTTTAANAITWPMPKELSTIPQIISTLSNLLFPIVGAVLLVMLIYAGITKMTAAGNADKEKQAMEIIKNAIIGTVIIVLARVIVDTISALLGTASLSS